MLSCYFLAMQMLAALFSEVLSLYATTSTACILAGFPNPFLKSCLTSIPCTVLQFPKYQICNGISTSALLHCCQLHGVSDLSPSQPHALHTFFPPSLSWLPSATSVCYFLEGRQPSKGKYFRTYSSSPPSFSSICH